MNAPTKITEKEAWEHVDNLWQKHNLKNEEPLTLELARPFIESYIKSVKKVSTIDDGLVLQIFNEIDDDGNQSLDRKEMFDFIMKQDFKEPNTPAPLMKKQTMNESTLKTKKAADVIAKKKSAEQSRSNKPSIYKEAMNHIEGCSASITPLPLKAPPQDKLHVYDDGEDTIYEGKKSEFNEKEGWGIKKWADGGLYVGMWLNNQANGKGYFFHSDGDVYAGDWVEDKANGNGTYLHVDGASYVGEWKEDKQTGQGKETWADGSEYSGNYLDGMKHGQGVYKWSDGSSYDGNWADNCINGKGTYKWDDGRVYLGSWENNEMHGDGEYTWEDGRKYSGSYKNDKKHGKGKYTWANGRTYDGDWKDGKQHGDGFYFNPDTGETRKGRWENGKRMEWYED